MFQLYCFIVLAGSATTYYTTVSSPVMLTMTCVSMLHKHAERTTRDFTFPSITWRTYYIQYITSNISIKETSRWSGGNTLAHDASGLGSTRRCGTLKLDTGYHPFRGRRNVKLLETETEWRLIDWLIDWLIGELTARQHRKVNLCQLRGMKPAQSAKDGQRDTMHNTLRYTITM